MDVNEFLDGLTEDQLFALMIILQSTERYTVEYFLDLVYEELSDRGLER